MDSLILFIFILKKAQVSNVHLNIFVHMLRKTNILNKSMEIYTQMYLKALKLFDILIETTSFPCVHIT